MRHHKLFSQKNTDSTGLLEARSREGKVKGYEGRIVGQAVVHGTSLAAAAGFISWIFLLFNIIIPIMPATFIAGLLVPIINIGLRKLETYIVGI